MEMFVRLRLRELLKKRKMTQAELARRTGLSEDRVSKLVRNDWAKLKRFEFGRLLHALRATPAELFEIYEPTVFFGALWNGPLKIHVSSRWLVADERGIARPHYDYDGTANLPLTFNSRDIEAVKLIQHYTGDLEILSKFETHPPGSMDPARFRVLVENGSHVIIGSNLSGELSEYALAHMYGAPPFDEHYLDRFPFTFSWGVDRSVQSSFGFEGARQNLPEGIYSTSENEIVATRTYRNSGMVQDCGVIAVYRLESPPGDDPRGIRHERCVIVLAGHGRDGTLGCAQLLVDPAYQERLYPEQAATPKMFVVQVQHFREPSSRQLDPPVSRELDRVEIVAEA
jgi:transcriptional regulator with XRE-family HTH domain